jgi:ABC-type enterochelin transport system permease subunit
MAVMMLIVVCWVAIQSSLVGSYQYFGGILVTTHKTAWCRNPEDHSQCIKFDVWFISYCYEIKTYSMECGLS